MTSWKWAIWGHCIKDMRAAMSQTSDIVPISKKIISVIKYMEHLHCITVRLLVCIENKHWRHLKTCVLLLCFTYYLNSPNLVKTLRILVATFNLIWPYFIITLLLKVVS